MIKENRESLPSGRQGFTLIELLVVIAIIGILAALVLVALGNARDKANDSRIKSNVGQLRTLAEVHYDSNSSSYANFGTCVGNDAVPASQASCAGEIYDSVSALTVDLAKAAGTSVDYGALSDGSNFCVESNLRSDPAKYVCVDESGQFVDNTVSVCTGTNIGC